jgi:precorrin-2 dehydrogenase / sirohydrochlorin ferrochelatase
VRVYPVNLRLDGRPVLVVGRGPVDDLVAAGADVTQVAPDAYEAGSAARYRLVLVGTGDRDVAQQVFDDADAAGVWVNSADDPERCSFIVPARVRRGDVLVTVSTGGRSPALASWLRRQLEQEIGPEYESLLEILAAEREQVRAAGESTEQAGWRAALESGMLDLVREGNLVAARELLRTCLSSSSG